MTDLTHWIDGRPVPPASGEYLATIDPSTGEPGARVAAGSEDDVALAVAAASRAFAAWRRMPSLDRGRLLLAIAAGIRRERDLLIAQERAETGKPLATASSEIENSAQYFEFYASLVHLPAGDVIDVAPDQHVVTRREPFGVIGVITPWNLPLNQAARAIAPALAAGNVVVAKPAESTSATTVALARIATGAGLPDGVLNVVLGEGAATGEALVRHPAVRKVAFTGSVRVGRLLGHLAAERVIPLTLELGGKSAQIVFDDADLDAAVAEVVRGFTQNAGQICSAGTRLLVARGIHDAFAARVAEAAGVLEPGRDLGPMITSGQFERVQEYFAVAEAEGARAVTGGSVSAGVREDGEGGFFVEPTVYVGVGNDARIAREEIFGPVLTVIPFDSEDDAVTMANDSDFGLICSVWTRDVSRALRMADAIEAGQVFVNVWNTGAVQTAFGGHKFSGYGREKGIEALHHYSHTKTITIKF